MNSVSSASVGKSSQNASENIQAQALYWGLAVAEGESELRVAR